MACTKEHYSLPVLKAVGLEEDDTKEEYSTVVAGKVFLSESALDGCVWELLIICLVAVVLYMVIFNPPTSCSLLGSVVVRLPQLNFILQCMCMSNHVCVLHL